jgi:hypothetical protein
MKIIVKTKELKEELIDQSKYIHDYMYIKRSRRTGKSKVYGLDSEKAGILMHIYTNPEIIEVNE